MAKKQTDVEATADETDSDGEGQMVLLETDHPARKQIITLCKKIKAQDAARSEAQSEADELRQSLGEVMHKHDLTEFRAGEFDVRLKPGVERVSVKKAAQGGDEGAE